MNVESTNIQATKKIAYPVFDRFYPWRRPCPQKILMVTDGYIGSFLNGSFSNYYFGLSAVIDTLLDQTDYFVNFKLTLAHRQVDTNKPSGPITSPEYKRYGPNFENFRFTTGASDIKTNKTFNIDDYDQIWLFGVRTLDQFRLSDGELSLLTDWMEKGGGVFATGDHADLGAGLCSRVPRASKMRMWTDVLNSVGNVIKSPPNPTGVDRHDTLVKGHDNRYTFDDESDDIPMKISPKFYYKWSWHPFLQRKHPHPILCGKDGVIDILPDHPHEGEVIESNQVKINDVLVNGNDEFPKYLGNNFRPEVIAHAHVQADHTNLNDSNKGAANGKTFGAIGAYDGYKTNVGRVIVDSTWHHWFDVNLIGRPEGNLNTAPFDDTNPKTEGFNATASGQAEYKRIQNYFINTGLWLAPKSDRQCMLKGLVWYYVFRYPAVERLNPKLSILELGVTARDALGRVAGQCNLTSWIFEILPVEFDLAFTRLNKKLPEQCLTCPPEELLEIYILGHITRNYLELSYKLNDFMPGDKKATALIDESIDGLFKKGIKEGVENMLETFDKNITMSRRDFRKLMKVGFDQK